MRETFNPEEIITQMGIDISQASEWTQVFKNKVILNKNDYWLKENEVCDQLGIIVSGMCRHTFTNIEGDEITRWVSLESDFITSLGSFVNGSKSYESIKAITNTEILVADKIDWMRFYNQNEFVRQYWTEALEKYITDIEERILIQISKKAQDRYAYLQKKYPRLVREVPNKYIASILGIEPRHLSRLRLK